MKKNYIILLTFALLAAVMVFGYQQYRLYETKKYSPEDEVVYENGNLQVQLLYNRPVKRGRVIFGDLVPFGQWWRTGANEATQITFSKAVVFQDGQTLPAGKYSIVTIPNPEEWVIIFNSNLPSWGTEYDPEDNVVEVKVPVETLPQSVEIFTIDFTEVDGQPQLTMAWDRTKVSLGFAVE